MNFNCASDSGATALAGAIQSQTANLTCMYLSGNNISGPGVKALAEATQKDKRLKQMYLRGNPIDDAGRTALEKVAQHHPSLVIFV
mmetsp:Transcript_41045/g.64097  ORF Transcript_41045/g.64097 Transcript_41045/m.64097 type:complete len:86 (+) Transcript_41045:255-512(+)